MRRTKIIATVGPASESPGTLAALINAGVDVVRLNASHSGVDELDARLRDVRAAAGAANRTVAVMLDLPGPKLRLGETPARQLDTGMELWLVASAVPGDEAVACEGCDVLAGAITSGDVIVIGDGDAELAVLEVSPIGIRTRVSSGGAISSRKGVTVRDVSLPLEPVTPADGVFLDWGIAAGIDLVAQSYVRRATDVDALRSRMGDADIPIVAKIERPEAVEGIEDIVQRADAIMVARGDLGVASSPERVPVYQRRIVGAARAWGRPVIVATQMLESMLTSPRPTRAEASDVANAVFDAVDAVMLSAETAVGSYPVESVATMARIVALAEEYGEPPPAPPRAHAADDVPWAVCAAVTELSRQLDLAAIVTATESGATARFVAAHRPGTPVVAVTMTEAVARRLALVWGVTPVVATEPDNLDDLMRIASGAALDVGYAPGSLIAITAGVAVNRPGLTDLIGGLVGAVAVAIGAPVLFGIMAYDVTASRKSTVTEPKNARLGIAVKRGIATAFVLTGGAFWSVATFAGLYSFQKTGVGYALLGAFFPLVACLATLAVGWYYERAAAALLVLASFGVIAWGAIYQFELGVWALMTIALIGPMMTAAVLFWLARRDQEAFDLAMALRPELAPIASTKSQLI